MEAPVGRIDSRVSRGVERSSQVAPDPSGELQPIEKVNLVEEIVERITAYILGQRLSPGDKLPPERELTASLRVGRSTIREAIKSLRAVGIVEMTARGPVVGRGQPEGLSKSLAWGLLVSPRGVREAVEARSVLEAALVRMAAERATDEEIAQIGRLLDEMRKATSGTAEYVEADLRFHLAIATAARNTLLFSVIETLHELNRAWMTRNVAEERQHAAIPFHEHEAIVVALRAHDPDSAEAAMSAHLTAAGDRLLDVVQREGRGEDVQSQPARAADFGL
jgi:GntR family transcriptional repressor for pyruvate dehydrogenase complex